MMSSALAPSVRRRVFGILIVSAIMTCVLLNTTVKCDPETTIEPLLTVHPVGLDAEFECSYSGAERVIAYDLFIENETLPVANALQPEDGSPAKLTIPASLQYGNIVVRCRATVEIVGMLPMFSLSNDAILKITAMGPLTIRHVNHMELNIAWENPFTTPVSFVVDVVHLSHSGPPNTVSSEHTNKTWHIFEAPDNIGLCEEFEFIVTPTNGSTNSSSNTTRKSYLSSGNGDAVVHCHETSDTFGVQCIMQYSSALGACNSSLRFTSIDSQMLDPYIDNIRLLVTGDGGTQSTYTVTAPNEVRPNRMYKVQVSIEVGGHSFPFTSQNTTTHDIVNATATECSFEGALNTSCSFVNDTKASGYLGVLSNRECGSSNDTVFFFEHGTDGQENILDGVGEGEFITTFFDLESDGLPSPGLSGAAQVRDVTIPDGSRDSMLHGSTSPLGEMNATRSDHQLCASCSSSNCLVLAYDCSNPDLLLSLVVNSSDQCIDIPKSDNPISVAFFQVTDSGGVGQQRHPDGQMMLDPPPFPTVITAPVSDEVVIAVSCGVCVLLAVLCGAIVILLCLYYKQKRSSKIKAIGTCEVTNKESRSVQPEGTSSPNEATLESDTQGHTEDVTPDFEIPEPTYAIPDNRRVMVKKATGTVNSTTVPAPTYADIAGHMHEAQVYVHVDVKEPGVTGDQMDVLEVQYAVLDETKLVTEVEPMEQKEPPPKVPRRPTPLNAENLRTLLTPAANKWYEIGLAMGFSQSILENEIQPGNSTDWLCLGEISANYCHTKHCWEEVVHILWEVEEWELADKICRQEGLQVERPTQEETVPPPPQPPKHTS